MLERVMHFVVFISTALSQQWNHHTPVVGILAERAAVVVPCHAERNLPAFESRQQSLERTGGIETDLAFFDLALEDWRRLQTRNLNSAFLLMPIVPASV